MTTFSSIPPYILGGACVSRGIMALLSPRKEYGNVGLLLESSKTSTEGGTVSPLMYFKGLRQRKRRDNIFRDFSGGKDWRWVGCLDEWG
ncbi:hypothetical protein F53441_13456 [Fusarium austroafricanum]|uniref:Uncharacterized protein n=1 Tax=Fusarium austroafricanum TaxID=2364996 RepID=A0A8H4NR92_9HYPO|nr:hypothetical protein F53441_13456 [Fusarium austroafricanum]